MMGLPATVTFLGVDNVVFSGAVSGGGALVQQGAGVVALTGASTYTGGTTVQAGVLSIGNGGTSGSIQGDVAVANSAVLAFNRSDDLTFAGAISGPGMVFKQGGDILSLVVAMLDPQDAVGSEMRGCGAPPEASTALIGSETTFSTGVRSSSRAWTNEVLAPFSSRRRTR